MTKADIKARNRARRAPLSDARAIPIRENMQVMARILYRDAVNLARWVNRVLVLRTQGIDKLMAMVEVGLGCQHRPILD